MLRPPLLLVFAAVVLALVGRVALSAEGQAGAPVAGTPVVCADDSYEENDVRDDAPPLLQPVEVAELVSCPDDTDWFAFHLFAGDHITIDAFYSDSSDDLNVSLYGPGGGFLVTAALVSAGDQRIAFSAPASGIYYVRIDPAAVATQGIDYSLRFSGNATPTPTPILPAPTPPGPLGDVNRDGRVDSIDAALVLQFIAGILNPLPNATSADVDINGAVDSIDAALILQYSAGIIGTF